MVDTRLGRFPRKGEADGFQTAVPLPVRTIHPTRLRLLRGCLFFRGIHEFEESDATSIR